MNVGTLSYENGKFFAPRGGFAPVSPTYGVNIVPSVSVYPLRHRLSCPELTDVIMTYMSCTLCVGRLGTRTADCFQLPPKPANIVGKNVEKEEVSI